MDADHGSATMPGRQLRTSHRQNILEAMTTGGECSEAMTTGGECSEAMTMGGRRVEATTMVGQCASA